MDKLELEQIIPTPRQDTLSKYFGSFLQFILSPGLKGRLALKPQVTKMHFPLIE